MARGEPVKQILVGHTVYGDYQGRRYKHHLSIKDKDRALAYAAANLGLENAKAYPIFKD